MKAFPCLSLAAFAALILGGSPAHADVRLPSVISEHMVLERTAKVPLWGWADPGEEISITLGTQSVKTRAGKDGKWLAALDLKDSAPGPFTLTFTGKNTITIPDVVVGEVWLASGQSNMEWSLEKTVGGAEAIAQASSPMLRVFTVERKSVAVPEEDVKGVWEISSPERAGKFSAVAYYFARELEREIKAPIGIIHSSWGGTPSEAWTSEPALQSLPDLKEASERMRLRLANFASSLEKYAGTMEPWMKETGRQDQATPDVAAFAGENVSPEGWGTLEVPPGTLPEGVAANGVIWFRKDLTLPASASAAPFRLDFKDLGGVESVYWNGKLLNEYTIRTHPGKGSPRRFYVPTGSVKEGNNTLAIRVFAPATPVVFSSPVKAGLLTLTGPWQYKVERAFPALDAAALGAVPTPPDPAPRMQDMPAHLFNGMIEPLIPYAIHGVIWYQGEANAARAIQYRTALPLLIDDWRAQWKQGDFPFYICQLANYLPKKSEPAESAWAELREAQTLTALKLPNTGLAVLIDVGESGDIHPRNKKTVGERLARIALARDYGKEVSYSGPLYKSVSFADGQAVVTFTHTDGGLVAGALPATYTVNTFRGEMAPLVRNSPASQLEGFQICGEDKNWVWADARIQGHTVIVSSEKVPAPVAVRYAWSDNPTCNLYNGEGLPAIPFRTDDFPATAVGIY